MKITAYLIQILLFSILAHLLPAQDCATFFPFEEGKTLTYQSYDKKGKPEGTITHNIREVAASGAETVVYMHSVMTDKKGKNTVESDYEVECRPDGYSFRLIDMMLPQLTEQFRSMDMEMEVEGENLFVPNELAVGKTLPDARMKMQPDMAGMNLMKFEYITTDREVTARETITTPAGTFDCYLVESKTAVKTMGTRVYAAKDWLAEGVGVVKSESYSEKGKLLGSMELQRIE